MKRFTTLLTALISAIGIFAQTQYSGTLPVLHINTDNSAPIVSKEEYVKGTFYLDALGIEGYESVGTANAPLPLQIRGRGNYTWTSFDKKPYRLKLDSKAALLGMAKSKHFALLAHADDNTGFLRNHIGFQVSRLVGLPWTPADKPIEVVLNGDYIGLYFLTETIRVDKDRVNIVEQADNIENTTEQPFAVTGGWLVEKDNYDSDPHVTIQENGNDAWFTYKTPEELSPQQESYLTEQLEKINDLIYSPDKTTITWDKMLDIDAFARFYVVQEVMDNYEAFHGSCYLNKDIDTSSSQQSLWKFGPVWDFGSSFIRHKDRHCYDTDYSALWIREAVKYPQFMEKVKEIWSDFYSNSYPSLNNYIDDFVEEISSAAICDADRWKQQGYGNRNLAEKAKTVKAMLNDNTDWLFRQWDGTPTENYIWTAYFKDNTTPAWADVYAYAYTEGKGNEEFLGQWPGTQMSVTEINGSIYNKITFKTDYDIRSYSPIIIFGNGGWGEGNQTENLKFIDGAIYDRTGIASTSSTKMPNNGLKIYAYNGILHIISPKRQTIRITHADGNTTLLPVEEGKNSIDLPHGFYIIDQTKIIL